MNIIDYFKIVSKNKIIFTVITLVSTILLTSLYFVFKDQIKYLNATSKVTQDYIISDNLNKNLFHDLLIDAEDLLNYQLEIEDSLNLDKYIRYESFSNKLMYDLLYILNEYDDNDLKMDIEFNQNSKIINLSITFFYELENRESLNKKNDILKLYLNDIQNKHKLIVQDRLSRYFSKINYFINTKTDGMNIYNTYMNYLTSSGIENFIDDFEDFRLKESVTTLVIRNTYDNTSSFQKPSIYFIFVLSLIVGIIISFSYVSFIFQKNNQNKKD